MTALVTALISQIAPYAIAAGGAIIAAIAWGFHQRMAGAKAERIKQATADAQARDISDQVQNDVGAMTQDAVRAELAKRAVK